MQTVPNILRIDGADAKITDKYGADARTPVLVIGTRIQFEFDLRMPEVNDETSELVPYPIANLDDIGSYYFALDGDFDQATTADMLVLEGISVAEVDGKTILTALLPNTNVAAVREALSTSETVTLTAEIGGFDTTPECSFAWQFSIIIRNRVYIEGDPPTEEEQDDYYTISKTEAAISRQLVFEFAESDSGPWHSDLVVHTDTHMRVRHGATGVASDAFEIPYGPQGLTGDNGVTWTPTITGGVLSWTNDGGLANPDPRDLNVTDGSDGTTFTPSITNGVLSWTNDGGETNPDPLDFGAITGDLVSSPAAVTELGKVYRRTATGWQLASPSDTECETCELWIALGASVAANGMRSGNVVVTNSSWDFSGVVPGTRIWLAASGAITATVPDATTNVGQAARPVGWVRDDTSIRFSGHMRSVAFEEAAS